MENEIDFIKHNYKRLAILCKLSYPSVFNQKKYGFDHQKMIHDNFKKPRAFARVIWNKNEMIIIFRGTKDKLIDWYTNIQIAKVKAKFGNNEVKIHKGFHKALFVNDRKQMKPAFDYLAQLIKENLTINMKLFITGHSLGGALAVVAGYFLTDVFPDRINGIITFGQPSVGNYMFKKNYPLNSKTIRISNGMDIVTFLPPLSSYYHVGHEFWIYQGRLVTGLSWLRKIFESIRTLNYKIFSSHFMEEYIKIHKSLYYDEIQQVSKNKK